MIQVEPASVALIPSFYECLTLVANEKIYIEMIEPPPLEKVTRFQTSLIETQGPIFYAVEDGKVVGWCDVFPEDNPRQNHRGGLGMGLLPAYRGRGLGTQLLNATLKRAQEFGLEKVELHVYTTNESAIGLYQKLGFVNEGLIRRYRKLDGQYFDCLAMGKFLQENMVEAVYRGTIIEESLKDPRWINDLKVTGVEISVQAGWHIYSVEVDPTGIKNISEKLRDGPWYAHFWRNDEMVVVFQNKIFPVSRSEKSTWKPAIEHGMKIGVPERQLDFLIPDEKSLDD